jgi:hypothetical protein
LDRHAIDFLCRESDSNYDDFLVRAQAFNGAIVKPPAVSDALAAAVERSERHQHDIWLDLTGI